MGFTVLIVQSFATHGVQQTLETWQHSLAGLHSLTTKKGPTSGKVVIFRVNRMPQPFSIFHPLILVVRVVRWMGDMATGSSLVEHGCHPLRTSKRLSEASGHAQLEQFELEALNDQKWPVSLLMWSVSNLSRFHAYMLSVDRKCLFDSLSAASAMEILP
jgi:hypothetical protein